MHVHTRIQYYMYETAMEVHVHIHTYIHVHTYTHTYMYTYIRSSCDEGYHWENYTFTNNSEKINVVRMLTEYGEAAQHVTIFGYYPGVSFATFEWLVIDLDFTTLNLSQCQQSDYYLWKPTDEVCMCLSVYLSV